MKALTKATLVDSSYNFNGTTGKYMKLYTCPEGVESTMITLYISNLDNGTQSISVGIKRNSTVIPFLRDKDITAKNYLHIWGGYVVLVPDDEVIIYQPTNSFSVIATFEENAKASLSASGPEPTAITV